MVTKEFIKHTGATFTPAGLADFLAEKLVKYSTPNKVRILDPACGEGELLFSIGNQLKKNGREFTLTGYDSNLQYLETAKKRLGKVANFDTELIQANFLNEIRLTDNYATPDLFAETEKPVNPEFDIVIANPPYVRTQILGSDHAQHLARRFNLKGRVDLYYPFLIAMTESLNDGGILGVITSNRYLFTKSGVSVRKYLSENYEVLELIDLGDTKLFNAAVLPAIFIGRKCKPQKPADSRFIKLYEDLNGYKGIYKKKGDIYSVLACEDSGYFEVDQKKFKKTQGHLRYKISSIEPWEMLTDAEDEWIKNIDRNAKCRIADFFKVRVGIKSNSDKIFIRDRWDSLGDHKPEDEILKDLISQENIKKWGLSDHLKLKVLYPHYSDNGAKKTIDLDKFPRAKAYLQSWEEHLKSRKYLMESGRKWYELWVSQNPRYWNFPKLVFPDISPGPRFCFDKDGKIVNGNCYWIAALNEQDVDKLLLIQGIANSKLMTKYHDLVFNNKLYSGRRRYFTQYVEKYPLPDFNTPVAIEIVQIVKMLNECRDEEKIKSLESNLEVLVAKSFKTEPVFILD